jgi:hypothetical protein
MEFSVRTFHDIAGQQLGIVKILRRDPKPAIDGSVRWLCLCTRGKAKWLSYSNLKKYPPKTHLRCHNGFELEEQK